MIDLLFITYFLGINLLTNFRNFTIKLSIKGEKKYIKINFAQTIK